MKATYVGTNASKKKASVSFVALASVAEKVMITGTGQQVDVMEPMVGKENTFAYMERKRMKR